MMLVLILSALSTSGADGAVDTSDAAVESAIADGVAYLIGSQNDDGSWGGVRNATFTSSFGNPATYHCWTVGTTALATRALLELADSPDARSATDSGLDFLIANADLRRPAEWDVDNVWGLVYGLGTLSYASVHPRYADSDRGQTLRAAAETMLGRLLRYQSPRGGWGYYANPGAAWRAEWSTSFTTAVGVLAFVDAREAGLVVPDKAFAAAVRAVERCRLPNGAYSYSVNALPRHMRLESINQVKGSLGRIQVCNLALRRAGAELPADATVEGLDLMFEYHKFLDVARNKPIPHEAYYAVAAYFYLFAHYYAALQIESLHADIRPRYAQQLRFDILKTRQADGAFWDFWIASTTKPYGTAFAIMALDRTRTTPGG